MNDPKPLASLGASLLARKGGAKPAMRPQLASLGAVSAKVAAQNLEDLGWNDMGEEDVAADHSADVLQLTPSPHNPEAEAQTDTASPRPAVRSMHEELAVRLAESSPVNGEDTPAIPLRKPDRPLETVADEPVGPTARKAAEQVPSRSREPSPLRGRRAAFTLRLDAKRHLKLRLASTVRNRSAQQLVTEALDRFLNDIPEIEALAAQVQRD